MRRAVWLTTIILLLALGTARAEGPTLNVQALPAGGWSAQGALSSAWAWIGPAAGAQELYALTLQVRATTGGPTLQLGSGGEAQPPSWWRWAIPADGKPHRIEMILDLPVGDKLGLSLSGAGAAQVDSLQLQPVTKPPAYTDALLTDPQPAPAAAPLPDGWQPQGTLDAHLREIGDATELDLSAGGAQISSPAELTVFQGVRQGPALFLLNNGDLAKTLQIAVAGPRGTSMPTYSIPLVPHSTTAFSPPVQLMRVGDAWVKYTFTVGTESASLPLKVHVKRLYPVLGVLQVDPAAFPNGMVVPEPVLPADVPYGLVWLVSPKETAPEQASAWPWVSDIALRGSQAINDLRDQVKQWDPPLLQLGLGGTGATPGADSVPIYRKVAEEVLPLGQDTAAVSPSWLVTPSERGLQVGPDMKAAFEAGLGKYVQSVGVEVVHMPQAGPLLEKIDGKAPATNAYWSNFNRQYDFTGLRQFLAANGAQLPLLLDLCGVEADSILGSRLEMLALTRLMLEGTWQGSTGTVVSLESGPTPEFAGIREMWRELWRELAGAQPVYLTPTEDGSCSRAPDAPVSYWPFLRGEEGIVFMANNTSAPQDLAVEVRGAPVQMQVLRISAFGAPVTREIEGIFRFGQEALHRHVQAIYLHLAPGEIVGLAVTLHGADLGWLRSIGRRPAGPYTPAQGPQPLQEPNTDPWVVQGSRF